MCVHISFHTHNARQSNASIYQCKPCFPHSLWLHPRAETHWQNCGDQRTYKIKSPSHWPKSPNQCLKGLNYSNCNSCVSLSLVYNRDLPHFVFLGFLLFRGSHAFSSSLRADSTMPISSSEAWIICQVFQSQLITLTGSDHASDLSKAFWREVLASWGCLQNKTPKWDQWDPENNTGVLQCLLFFVDVPTHRWCVLITPGRNNQQQTVKTFQQERADPKR